MRFDRRSFLRLLLASAAAEAVDFEQLLWVPKPIITVPGFPTVGGINRAGFLFWRNQQATLGQVTAQVWEEIVSRDRSDNVFSLDWLKYR